MSLAAADNLAEHVHDALLPKAKGNYFVSTLGVHALLMAVLRNAEHMSEETLVKVEYLLASSREEFPGIVAAFDDAIAARSTDTAFAAAGWLNPVLVSNPATQGFMKTSPVDGAQVGIPSQDALDAWVSEKSLGIITEFPGVDPDALAVLANVLATDISWASKYDTVATPSNMAGWGVNKVLVSSGVQRGHSYAVVRETPEGPLLGVSVADSESDGLQVISVIGDLSDRDLLRVAEKYAADPDLFLPVGLDSLLPITDERTEHASLPEWLSVRPMKTAGPARDIYIGYLPAWDADASYDISGEPSLAGLNAAVLDGVAGSGSGLVVSVLQVVKAAYFAEGFKAAALTTAMIGRSAMPVLHTVMEAKLSYNKSYAVVAVDKKARLSVFSGVIREAVEA